MYKIQPLSCPTDDADEQATGFQTINELASAGLVAQTTLLETIQKIIRMREALQPHHRSTCAEFGILRDNCVSQITSAEYKGVAVFDGHIDSDVVFTGDVEESIRVCIPDLVGLLNKFHSNFSEISRVDDNAFAERVAMSERTRISPCTAIQGMRLNTFMTRTVKASRIEAINSLSRLSGLHATSYGNALVSSQICNQTQMPVHNACIRINGVAIDGCDGTVTNLTEQINLSTHQHGVRAVGQQGQPMTLISYSGHKIEITVSNQAGALLSGFPPGVSDAPSQSGGLIVWISFTPIHTVNFDSIDTGKLIAGLKVSSVALKLYSIKDLSIDTPLQRQLSTYVLQAMQRIVERESDCLSRSLVRLKDLLHANPKEANANSDINFSRQLV